MHYALFFQMIPFQVQELLPAYWKVRQWRYLLRKIVFIVGNLDFLDKIHHVQFLLDLIFLEDGLIGNYFTVGDHKKEMAIQVGSQVDVQLIFNLVLDEDMRDL